MSHVVSPDGAPNKDYRRLAIRVLLECYSSVSPRFARVSSAMAIPPAQYTLFPLVAVQASQFFFVG
jgi:hypothetical protein